MTLAVAEAALTAAGFSTSPLRARHGWANEAWIGQDVVVRISSGRLRSSLAHESTVVAIVRSLNIGVPVAEPLAHGRVGDLPPRRGGPEGAEWLVSRRVAGETLAVAWNDLGPSDRRRVGHQLGYLLQQLHAAPCEAVAPPWWRDAQATPEELHNCYHPPPGLGPRLVAAARETVGADAALLDEVEDLLRSRLHLFADDQAVLAHTDIHAHNLLIAHGEPRITGILDWEGARHAAPDVELDMFLRYVFAAHAFPERPGAPVRIAPGDMIELVDHVANAYPDLFSSPSLLDRLEVYDAHWHLIQVLVENRLHGTALEDPAWERLRELLRGNSHLHRCALLR